MLYKKGKRGLADAEQIEARTFWKIHGDVGGSRICHQSSKGSDRSRIKAGKTRIKEWDYYLIHNDSFGVALTVADNTTWDWCISFLDFKERREVTKSPMLFLPMGRLHMPWSSETGDVRAGGKGWNFSFEKQKDRRILRACMDDFSCGKPIKLKIAFPESRRIPW